MNQNEEFDPKTKIILEPRLITHVLAMSNIQNMYEMETIKTDVKTSMCMCSCVYRQNKDV